MPEYENWCEVCQDCTPHTPTLCDTIVKSKHRVVTHLACTVCGAHNVTNIEPAGPTDPETYRGQVY